jgi:flavorubredoxin
MTTVTEIGPALYRLSTYVPAADMQFNQFLAVDDEPLLFHAGPRAMFPAVREAVARVIEPSRLRWVGFSHFEADECGALNEWLAVAPRAEPVCGLVGAVVSVNDFASRPARTLAHDEVLVTGRQRFRFRQTPHVPHAWEAGLLFEETAGTLLCSDLFHQGGDVEPLTGGDVVGRARETLLQYQAGPFADYMPWTPRSGQILEGLAGLAPRTLAAMHGSAFAGNGAAALRDLAAVMRDVLAGPPG